MSIKSTTVSVPAARVAYVLATPDFEPGFAGIVSGFVDSLAPADVIFVSFDGVNDHLKLIPGTSGGFESSGIYEKVWLRSAAAGALNVWLTTETNRAGV
jgi:hypothetical protein